MSINPPTACAFCGGPWDHDEKRLCIIPKAWAHERCMLDIEAKDPTLNNMWKMADSIPCCAAKVSMTFFGGTIIQKFSEIPDNEVWMTNSNKKIDIYTIQDNGNIVLSDDKIPARSDNKQPGSNHYPNRPAPPPAEPRSTGNQIPPKPVTGGVDQDADKIT